MHVVATCADFKRVWLDAWRAAPNHMSQSEALEFGGRTGYKQGVNIDYAGGRTEKFRGYM